jgi:diaminopimelate epimerase
MALSFSKMHGLGNDFVVFDATRERPPLTPEFIRRIATRRFGIGCDQVLVVEAAENQNVDFHYRIFNADGKEVEQCGNGARCFARFVRDRGLCDKDEIVVSTHDRTLLLQVREDGRVAVDMGRPGLDPDDIPLRTPARAARYRIDVDGTEMDLGAASMGNPHAVLLVGNVDAAPVDSLGPRIEHHPAFPARANVGFLEVVNRGHARLRVFERGVGETLACGSGACAAAVVGQVQGLLDERVILSLPGGDLEIEWAGLGAPVMMTGPAEHVFDGQIEP